MAITVLQLRQSVATALSGLVGTYTLANGATTPALAVRSPGEPRTPGTKVSGMEVLIVEDPDMSRVVRGYRESDAIRSWDVFLVAWSDSTRLEPAVTALLAAFPGATVQDVPVPENAGPRNQKRLTIPSNP